MDMLLECAKAYEKLLDVQYRIIIGKKGTTKELRIHFSKWDFHHLAGLGKLKDIRIARKDRALVFDEILRGVIDYKTISKSRYISLIEKRFIPLSHIEDLFDNNRLIFRYNIKLNRFSLIEADYLLSTPYECNDIYIFLTEEKEPGVYFCRSFFPKEQTDYTKGQAVWTMLYKEKIHRSVEELEIQYNRIKPSQKNEEYGGSGITTGEDT